MSEDVEFAAARLARRARGGDHLGRRVSLGAIRATTPVKEYEAIRTGTGIWVSSQRAVEEKPRISPGFSMNVSSSSLCRSQLPAYPPLHGS